MPPPERRHFPLHPIATAMLASVFASPIQAQERDAEPATEHVPAAAAGEQAMEAITVKAGALSPTTEKTGSYTGRATSTATGLDLSLRETPQSVSVVTRSQMNDFGITDVNDALRTATGINVESVETDRTYYTARGFDITNFQMDGVGLPLTYGNLSGNLDAVIYDRIEVLRGGTGLMAGMSDPSATINFARKRPTAKFQASANATVGSWNKRRAEADVAGRLNASGSVRARLVAAYLDRDSYLDRYGHEKAVLYGVVEADLAPSTVLTLGHQLQNNHADSPLWGSLPLFDTSGTPTRYSASTSSATDWSYWDGRKSGTFAELAHDFDSGWRGKAVLNQSRSVEKSRLFYVYGTPDPTTAGSDLYAYPSLYDSTVKHTLLDISASGPFALFGREHELIGGISWASADLNDMSTYGEDIGTEIAPLETWGGVYPMPNFTGGTNGSTIRDKQASLYGATRLKLSDKLTAIGGARLTDFDSRGVSYGLRRSKSYDKVFTPYAGLSYRINDTYSAYASVTRLFRPQTEVDVSGDRLDAVRGNSKELGIKGEFLDKKLNATLALFKSGQTNLAKAAGFGTFAFHTASDRITSSGYEIDIAGEVLTGLQLSGGYTYVRIDDTAGNPTRTQIPRRTAKLAVSYRVRSLPGLKIGGSVNWQDAIHYVHTTNATTGPNAGSPIVTRQESFALLNLMAQFEISKHLSASLNINNVTNQRHYQSLYWASWGQAYTAAPRNGSVTLTWTY